MKWIRFIATGVFIASTFAAITQSTTPAVNVWAWGDKTSLLVSEMPKDLTNAISVSLGEGPIEIAAKANGTVVAWGNNVGHRSEVPPGLSNVVAIAAGYQHNLAVRADGNVVAWGDNNMGECDVPSNATNVVAVDAGHYHSLALRADGTVVAWGWNADGQCDVPLDLPRALAVSAGGYSSMALVDPTQASTSMPLVP